MSSPLPPARARVTLGCGTDPRWLPFALGHLDEVLIDHAHCEKKAAATALKLIADHADRPALVRPLARLAQEEQQHLMACLLYTSPSPRD